MSVDTLTVVPQNSSSIPQFNRALGVGTCSPTTTTAVGNSPLVNLVYDYFSFTIIKLAGRFDNSSITSFTLTPAGGSTLTFNVNTFTYYSGTNESQWGSSDSYRNLVAGTTYTIQFFSGSTNINTEGVTLERRNPKDMNDFYGATRNVPPVSGAFKLSWLKNAVKYQFSSAMTIAQYVYQQGNTSIATYTGYSTTILPAIGLSGTLGSMTDSSVDSIINFYNGATFTQILVTNPTGSQSHVLAINMTQTATNRNSEWYKVSFTPSGGSEVAFYREDLTYSRSGTTHSWVKTLGSTPLSAGSGTFKLTC